jgi:hypothetical protein
MRAGEGGGPGLLADPDKEAALDAQASMLPDNIKQTPPNLRCSVAGRPARAARMRDTRGLSDTG